MHFARVHVHVVALVVDVVCLMLVLSALVVLHMLYLYCFRSQFSVVCSRMYTLYIGETVPCERQLAFSFGHSGTFAS